MRKILFIFFTLILFFDFNTKLIFANENVNSNFQDKKNIYAPAQPLFSKYSKILYLDINETGRLAAYYNHSIAVWLPEEGNEILFLQGNKRTIYDFPLLIIPSGTLESAYEKNIINTKKMLSSYVENGGIIFCFSQPYGKYYSLIPGNIKSYGYYECQSFRKNNCIIEYYHPILSSFTKRKLSAECDGFFYSYPKNTKVLMRDIRSGYPVMISYHYGKGEIILTSLCEDYNYGEHKISSDGLEILKNVFSYYKNKNKKIVRENIPYNEYPQVQGCIVVEDEYLKKNRMNSFKIHLRNNSNHPDNFFLYLNFNQREEKLLDKVTIPPGKTLINKYSFFLNNITAKRILNLDIFDADKLEVHTDRNPRNFRRNINHPLVSTFYKVIFCE